MVAKKNEVKCRLCFLFCGLLACRPRAYELSFAVGHEKSVTIVNGVPQLERKHRVRSQVAESLPQLWWGQPKDIIQVLGKIQNKNLIL